MNKTIKKWTYYYGYIQQVTLDQNEKSEFIGYHNDCGIGVFFQSPYKTLSPNVYFDTKEKAIAGYKKNWKRLLEDGRVTLSYLKKQQTTTEEYIKSLDERIKGISKLVLDTEV